MDQNQNTPPPNFDFIMNQPEPHAKPPGKMNVKVIIIIMLVLVLGLILLIAIFLPNNNEQNSTSGNEEAAETTGIIPSAEDSRLIVGEYLQVLKTRDFRQAYTYFGQEIGYSQTAFFNQYGPMFVADTIDECEISTPDAQVPNRVQVVCPRIDNQGTKEYKYFYTVEHTDELPFIAKIQISGAQNNE